MMGMNRVAALLVILAVVLLVACGGSGGDAPEPTVSTDDQISSSVQQTVAAIAVAQTVAAITEGQPTPTLVPAQATAGTLPTPVVQPSATVAPAEATAPPPTQSPPTLAPAFACTVVSDVNMRPGPGTVYGPVIAAMSANTQLAPLAYSAVGFPQGPWLLAQIAATGQVGWVSARPQYILCNVDFGSLPVATNLPPTPTPPPAPTPTATTAVLRPPTVENDAPGGSFPEDGSVTFNIIVDPAFLFRMDVRVLSAGNFEGAGIESVGFSISGDGVDYFREERTAGFCVFGGGEPTCNPWPTNAQGQYTWGVGGPIVESGEYFVNMAVTADEPDPEFFGQWNWNFPFTVTVP
jgi:hypothetical protein